MQHLQKTTFHRRRPCRTPAAPEQPPLKVQVPQVPRLLRPAAPEGAAGEGDGLQGLWGELHVVVRRARDGVDGADDGGGGEDHVPQVRHPRRLLEVGGDPVLLRDMALPRVPDPKV